MRWPAGQPDSARRPFPVAASGAAGQRKLQDAQAAAGPRAGSCRGLLFDLEVVRANVPSLGSGLAIGSQTLESSGSETASLPIAHDRRRSSRIQLGAVTSGRRSVSICNGASIAGRLPAPGSDVAPLPGLRWTRLLCTSTLLGFRPESSNRVGAQLLVVLDEVAQVPHRHMHAAVGREPVGRRPDGPIQPQSDDGMPCCMHPGIAAVDPRQLRRVTTPHSPPR